MTKAIIANVIIAYVMFVLFAYFVSDQMIFVPPAIKYQNLPEFIHLPTADGENITALYLPNQKAKYTILVSHGNAEDIISTLPMARALYAHGFSVLIYDYHGYGLSSGYPTEHNAYLDIDATYSYLTKIKHIAPSNIIVYGHSLGAAVALDLAIRQPVAAVILQGGFITAFRVITFLPLLPFDKFNNLEKITKLKCPILIIHGTRDMVVPFWQGKMLYEKALVFKQFYRVDGAGHSDVLAVAGKKYWQVVANFLQQNKL